MTELEKKAERLAKDFMDGKVESVIFALHNSSTPREELVFLAVDTAKRLDQTAELIFRRALHNAAIED